MKKCGFAGVLSVLVFGTACVDVVDTTLPVGEIPDSGSMPDLELEHPDESVIYEFANSCVSIFNEAGGATQVLASSGDSYEFQAGTTNSAKFFMKASDLGTYLFYDQERGYLVSEDGPLVRQETLQSDVYLVSDEFISGAEWHLVFSERASNRFALQHRRTGQFLGANGLVATANLAAILKLESAEGCLDHPELSLDASGEVLPKTYEDGSIYGYVDTHSHILSNFGFGGGGIFHGAPFHRLGVEHALGSCEPFHAEEGRADLLGSGFGDGEALEESAIIGLLGSGRLPEPSHRTDGWPTFSDWPSTTFLTHQTQYYKWIERAWMSGLRLVVQHAVSNEMFCELMAGPGFQPARWGCRDMLNIERQIAEVRVMERYIDAQAGGPGKGFFRVVDSPAQAREVIAQGKLAVLLGIEVPNLFDCYLTPRPDSPVCDTAHIESELDRFHEMGVRVLFPNHKYDNAFTPGDGHRGIIELGSFATSGHWSNFVQDCPDVQTAFDFGPVQFGGLNKPREEYLSEAENDLLVFTMNPLQQLIPYLGALREPPLEGDWCQKAGLTEAGETLIRGIMRRGMIPDIDHLPRRSYLDVFALLEEANYPATSTHGTTHGGKIFEIGGTSKAGFARCANPDEPGSMAAPFRHYRDQIVAAGGYPAIGFGFDFNGMATMPRARFGPNANCAQEQESPVEYPFTSYDGAVTFEQPRIGDRSLNFNTEGMVHIGLAAELIEDARRTGVSDEDMDILFRSAEAYLRMWELAEARSLELR